MREKARSGNSLHPSDEERECWGLLCVAFLFANPSALFVAQEGCREGVKCARVSSCSKEAEKRKSTEWNFRLSLLFPSFSSLFFFMSIALTHLVTRSNSCLLVLVLLSLWTCRRWSVIFQNLWFIHDHRDRTGC